MTDPNAFFTTLIKPVLPLFLLLAGIYGVKLIYRLFRASIKGALGEALVNQGTFRLLDKERYRGFNDLYVPRPNGDGLTQVDHAVVSPHGIFVIETKNFTGWIFGSEHQAKWTQTFGTGRKFSFQNPIWQNKLHIAALAKFLKLPESKFRSVIFFMGGCTFKTEMPASVVDAGLTSYITGHKEVLLTPEEVAGANAALVELVKGTNKRTAKREVVEGIEKRVARARG